MRGKVLVPFLLLIFSPLPAYEGCSAGQTPPVLNLCELVGKWRDYHGKQVRVRAIYRVGAEQAWLYDPACRNGEGLTDVSFREDMKGSLKKLDQLVAKDKRRRAWVVFEGVFYGPEAYGDKVDPKLPAPIRERFEKAPRRYGHMGSMESMIEVTKVVEAAKVPADVP
jgi:hypothetical protein